MLDALSLDSLCIQHKIARFVPNALLRLFFHWKMEWVDGKEGQGGGPGGGEITVISDDIATNWLRENKSWWKVHDWFLLGSVAKREKKIWKRRVLSSYCFRRLNICTALCTIYRWNNAFGKWDCSRNLVPSNAALSFQKWCLSVASTRGEVLILFFAYYHAVIAASICKRDRKYVWMVAFVIRIAAAGSSRTANARYSFCNTWQKGEKDIARIVSS